MQETLIPLYSGQDTSTYVSRLCKASKRNLDSSWDKSAERGLRELYISVGCSPFVANSGEPTA